MASALRWAFLLLAGSMMCSAKSRISGGADASIENYTSLVQVENLVGIFWVQSCAGTILTSKYVLTAAQCFHGILYQPAFRRIRAGSSERGTGGEVANVQGAVNHPNFDSAILEADISVVELTSSLEFTAVITPGIIVAVNVVLPDNLSVKKVGWGATSADESSSDILQETEVVTINRDECMDLLGDFVSLNQFCAGQLEEERAACSGDVGGPVYYGDIVVGVISKAHGCSDEVQPDVNTAVSSYTDWIIGQTL